MLRRRNLWVSNWICLESDLIFFYFFFFQAEDGIRDGTVTGVQTYALPICALSIGSRGDALVPVRLPVPVRMNPASATPIRLLVTTTRFCVETSARVPVLPATMELSMSI